MPTEIGNGPECSNLELWQVVLQEFTEGPKGAAIASGRGVLAQRPVTSRELTDREEGQRADRLAGRAQGTVLDSTSVGLLRSVSG